MESSCSLVNSSSGEVLIPRLGIATTFWQRFRGLQFRRKLADDEGLLIVPCRAIHTHWMRFPIDIVLASYHGIVLQKVSDVKPWRVVAGDRMTHAVIESAAGTLACRVSEGDQLGVLSDIELSVFYPREHDDIHQS